MAPVYCQAVLCHDQRIALDGAPAEPFFARVEPALGAALDAYLNSLQPRSRMTAVVELVLKKHLQKVGFWPPPQDPTP